MSYVVPGSVGDVIALHHTFAVLNDLAASTSPLIHMFVYVNSMSSDLFCLSVTAASLVLFTVGLVISELLCPIVVFVPLSSVSAVVFIGLIVIVPSNTFVVSTLFAFVFIFITAVGIRFILPVTFVLVMALVKYLGATSVS